MRVYIAGHKGMVGKSLLNHLKKDNDIELVYSPRKNLDLIDATSVNKFFKNNNIDQVYLAAAKVGGINANNIFPAEFIYENLMIQTNVIHASHQNDINNLVFLGSSCIYPKQSTQPIKENFLLDGKLEATNEPYALAKIAGIKLCESYNRQYSRDYRSVMPTNLYGPNDNFHPENSHVVPALIQRFHKAKVENLDQVVIWGTGNAKREFLYVDEMTEACIYIANLKKDIYMSSITEMCSHINIGTGSDCTIKDLAHTIAEVVEFKGEIIYDHAMPDGTPRKLLDVSKLSSMGWESSLSLHEGLVLTYEWYLENVDSARNK